MRPIAEERADYAKGNRFFELEDLAAMPRLRLFGNAMLSLVNKAASGYWDVMDPTNGFVAIHARVAARLPLDKIADDYFFESDLLFRLGTLRAVVVDMPMVARYDGAPSSLRVGQVALRFPTRYLGRFFKRDLLQLLPARFQRGHRAARARSADDRRRRGVRPVALVRELAERQCPRPAAP